MKFRTEIRTRPVQQTFDGITETVHERYEVQVPELPPDWDQRVDRGILTATTVMVVASVIWSTISIGDLLTLASPAPAAYAGAMVFDIAWITCLAAEWRARYDRAKADRPRKGGYAALVIAMAAVGVHGWITWSEAVGIIGALVPLIAKGMSVLALDQAAFPLDDLSQQWLDKQRAKIGAQLALVAGRRQLARLGEQALAQQAALAAATQANAHIPAPSPTEDTVSRGADTSVSPPPSLPSAAEIAAQLHALGIAAAGAGASVPSIGGDAEPSVQLRLPEEDEEVVRPISPPGASVRNTIKTAVACGIRDSASVLKYAQSVHGPNVNAETVERYRRDFIKKAG
ncbi:protein transporter Sec31 [Streptomyces abikoensis]|uniref:protein transporter Sec31 n=1 Tax=Streptomyces abikoensis TaxID=97398 RepID=UPI001672E6F9|nr:protein transporter Sec31 [Streptomyces abikoensis]